jgi:hypothetical protein
MQNVRTHITTEAPVEYLTLSVNANDDYQISSAAWLLDSKIATWFRDWVEREPVIIADGLRRQI